MGGAAQVRPWRPRPSLCSPAVTTVPCGAPAAASSRARVLVESVRAKWRCGWPKLTRSTSPCCLYPRGLQATGGTRPWSPRGVREEGGEQAVYVVALGFDVDVEAGGADGVAGDRADRGDAGVGGEAVAERVGEVADGRGGGEGDVVGGLRRLDGLLVGGLADGFVEGDDEDLCAALA